MVEELGKNEENHTERGSIWGGGEYCVPEMSLKVFWEVGLQLREKSVDWAIPYFLY